MGDFQIGIQIPTEHMQNIFGNYDSYIRKIEDDMHVIITDRNGEVRIVGEEENVKKAVKLLQELVELSIRGNLIQEQNVSANPADPGEDPLLRKAQLQRKSKGFDTGE